jgi:hypothetical protein
MQEEYNSLLENQNGISFPFLQEGNLLGADGSTGPGLQRMDKLAGTKPW